MSGGGSKSPARSTDLRARMQRHPERRAGTSLAWCRSRWYLQEAEGQSPSQTVWSHPAERDRERRYSEPGAPPSAACQQILVWTGPFCWSGPGGQAVFTVPQALGEGGAHHHHHTCRNLCPGCQQLRAVDYRLRGPEGRGQLPPAPTAAPLLTGGSAATASLISERTT